MPGPPAGPAAIRSLEALVGVPTVSSDPAHAGDVRRCARGLAARLERAGFAPVRLHTPARHPIVVAEHRRGGRPVVLLYTHYDVQPPGPGWTSPPFAPTRRGADLVGRGASDDKGQLLCHLLAVERLLAHGPLPVDVVMVLDGEEEIGSPGLPAVLEPLVRRVRPSAALISDTRMLGPGRPAVTVGLRGSLAVELELRGPREDLHSGAFGGAVHNPLQALCEVVAGLHEPSGRIAVEGLYAGVRRLPPGQRRLRGDRDVLAPAGVPRGWGEPGLSAYERTVARPALTVNGLTGGHQGPGPKSVIPARAAAKLSLRLVPGQSPDAVERALRAHLARAVPPTQRWRLTRQSSSAPVLLDAGDAAHRAAERACRAVWGRPPVPLRSGGSIGAVELLTGRLGVPAVLLGFALPDDRAHGPDEKFHLPHLALGAATVAAFLREYAAQAVRPRRHMRTSSGLSGRPLSRPTSSG
jgi:acetylornithine deacetylase/succinyl-diaminopimelate desuccinylase-like protein